MELMIQRNITHTEGSKRIKYTVFFFHCRVTWSEGINRYKQDDPK